ncbi:hypothetical protein VTN31DRAFT_7438 [Thermomyces dupontii]|uniref:uncharacterized protein n=1 Tax=Talaromyces thermophilus TaxID=28565 RepID=UPI003743DEAD
MAQLSVHAIIAIALAGAVLAVTMIVAFRGYLGAQEINKAQGVRPPSHEQLLYMREVRQRMHRLIYAESVAGTAPPSVFAGGSRRGSQLRDGAMSPGYMSHHPSSVRSGEKRQRGPMDPGNITGMNGHSRSSAAEYYDDHDYYYEGNQNGNDHGVASSSNSNGPASYGGSSGPYN